jgi:glycine betaine catabolism B
MTEIIGKKLKPTLQKAIIEEVIKETKDTSTLRLKLENPFEWEPGQFIMVSADINGEKVRRAYSIASSPTRDLLDITIRQTDTPTMSKYLNERKGGDELDVKGPYGKFIWTEKVSPNLVCLGAGSGITPFRAFLQYIIDKKLDNKIVLLYSCGYGDNVIFKDELEKLVKQVKNCNYGLYITRDPMGISNVKLGRINKKALEAHVKDLPDANYYLCGTPGFVSSLIEGLQEIGVDKNHIKREQWG